MRARRVRLKNITPILGLTFAGVLMVAGWGCSSQPSSDKNAQADRPEQQQAQENGRKLGEKAREAEIRTRDERAKLNEEARQAGKKLEKASVELAAKTAAAAEGIRAGWNEGKPGASSGIVDINHATAVQLSSLGLSSAESQAVIRGRPYKSKRELVSRNILSEAAYRGVQERIVVK